MKRYLGSGYFLAIVGALGFSSKSILTKFAFSYGVDAMTLLVMRVFIALPFFPRGPLLGRGEEGLQGDGCRALSLCLLRVLQGWDALCFYRFIHLNC